MKPLCHGIAHVVLLLFSVYSYSQTGQDTSLRRFQTDSFKLKKESRFFFNIHGGYNVGLGPTFKFYPDDVTLISVEVIDNNPSTRNVTYRANGKGLGDGIRYGAGLSYILNDFINLGIDLDYFRSTIRKVRDSSYSEVNTATSSQKSYEERYTISYDASLLTITPHITFKAISRPGFFIYNKVGAVLTIRPNSIQRERKDTRYSNSVAGPSADSTAYNEKKYDWGLRNPATGFMGAVGSQVKLTKKVRGFAELQFTHVLFKVRSRTLTDYIINGDEQINTLSTSEKKIEFEKELTADELNQDPDLPSKQIVQRFPVTYIGVQVGLVYRF